MPGALDGITVIDATQMLAGPLAATRLGDLGADVIKLEPPLAGEFNRTHGLGDVRVEGEMSTFLAVNRNKRSLALDLKDDDARAALLAVVADADVFLQNFRHGTAERLGIGWEQLHAVNPRLVYCSISGYGPTGPYRDRPGQDLVIQGYSGSMWAVGRADEPPRPGALWAADAMTGYQAAIGILAALAARERTGRGQHVEIDMLSVVLDAQLQELVTYLNTGVQHVRPDGPTAHAAIPAPYGVYRTADGWLTLAMSPLPALGDVLDDDYLRGLTDYNDGMIHRDAVYAHLEHLFEGRTTAEWIAACDRAGVWAGPVYDYEQLAADPHVSDVGYFVDQPHHTGVPVRTSRVPVRLSETPTGIRIGAPALGEHSRAVLAGAGIDSERIDALVARGAVRDAPR